MGALFCPFPPALINNTCTCYCQAPGTTFLNLTFDVISSSGADADVIGLTEVDSMTIRDGNKDETTLLCGALPGCSAANCASFLMTAVSLGYNGVATIAKHAVLKAENISFASCPIDTPNGHGAVATAFNISGLSSPLWVINFHLDTNETQAVCNTKLVLTWVAENIGFSAPHVLMGDMNTVPTQPAYALLAAHYQDAYEGCQQHASTCSLSAFPRGATRPTGNIAANNSIRIDYIWFPLDWFSSANFRLLSYSTPFTIASDHLPVVVDISF